jgi:hypothetical protein
MASEMVLIPKAAYEKWVMSENTVEMKNDDEKLSHGDKKEKTNVSDNSSSQQHEEKNNAEDSDEASVERLFEEDNKKSDTVPFSLIERLPSKYRLYGKRLLSYIKRHGGKRMAWDEDDNALIYNGSKVEGSDIIDLVLHVFKTNKRPPLGMNQFMKGSDEIRVPKSFFKPYKLNPPGIRKSIKNKWVKY